MKNKYNIKFKHGINYRGEIDAIIFKLINGKNSSTRRIISFDKSLNSINKRTLRQLRNFISQESFDLHSDESGNLELKKVLQEMLPSLFLRKNQALVQKLKLLGFKPEIRNLFIEKRKLDQCIQSMMKNMDYDNTLEACIRGLLYSIISVKCRLKMQEALGFGEFVTNERYLTDAKKSLEEFQRTLREGEKISTKDLNKNGKKLVNFMNSPNGKFFIDRNNEIASQNHTGSYNVRFLAFQLFLILKLSKRQEVSTRQILISLYDIFRMIYSEKKLFTNEEQWLKSKKSRGKNFTYYKIKKVSDIVGYKGEKQILEYLKKYEPPNANLNLQNLQNIISKN